MNEDKIEEIIKEKLQEAYSEILDGHGIESGDVGIEEQIEFDKKEDELIETTKNWIARGEA